MERPAPLPAGAVITLTAPVLFSSWRVVSSEGMFVMAQKDSKGNSVGRSAQTGKASKSKSSFTDIKFINFNLSDHQKGLFDAWVSEGVDLFDLAESALRGGYKLSFGEDVQTGAIMCTITNRSGQPEFAQHCFTLRGRDYVTALARVLYVHHIVCEGDWGVIAEASLDDDAW